MFVFFGNTPYKVKCCLICCFFLASKDLLAYSIQWNKVCLFTCRYFCVLSKNESLKLYVGILTIRISYFRCLVEEVE